MKASTFRVIVGGYFGFALSCFANIHITQWQFYAIIVPVIVGYGISSTLEK